MAFITLAGGSIQLVPDGTLFLHIALVLFMIYVLNRTLFRPINRVLEEREKRSQEGSGVAQANLLEVDKKLTQYELSLREARARGYQLLEHERNAALVERQEQISSLREDLTRSTQAEKNLIRGQTDRSRSELNEEAVRLATKISASILGRSTQRSTN